MTTLLRQVQKLILGLPISVLDFSERIEELLERGGIRTIGQLVSQTKKQLDTIIPRDQPIVSEHLRVRLKLRLAMTQRQIAEWAPPVNVRGGVVTIRTENQKDQEFGTENERLKKRVAELEAKLRQIVSLASPSQ